MPVGDEGGDGGEHGSKNRVVSNPGMQAFASEKMIISPTARMPASTNELFPLSNKIGDLHEAIQTILQLWIQERWGHGADILPMNELHIDRQEEYGVHTTYATATATNPPTTVHKVTKLSAQHPHHKCPSTHNAL